MIINALLSVSDQRILHDPFSIIRYPILVLVAVLARLGIKDVINGGRIIGV